MSDVVLPPPPRSEVLDLYASIASARGWRRGRAGMPVTPRIPTPFLHFNWRTGWGGLPGGRIVTMRGPTHHGKTRIGLAFVRPYVQRRLPVALIEPENTLEPDFVETTWGSPSLDEIPNVVFPEEGDLTSFRGVSDFFDKFTAFARSMWETQEWVRDLGGSVALLDSLDAMQPPEIVKAALEAFEGEVEGLHAAQKKKISVAKKGELREKLEKQRKGWAKSLAEERTKIEKGNADQRKASLNRVFLSRLNVLASYSRTLVLLVTHEKEVEEGTLPGGKKRVITESRGGKAIALYSTMVLRCTKALEYRGGDEGSKGRVVGDRTTVRMHKNKMGYMDGSSTPVDVWFSNGTEWPAGIDFARDAVETGILAEILEKRGNHVVWTERKLRLGNGVHAACDELWRNPELLADLRRDVEIRELATREVRRKRLQLAPALAGADGDEDADAAE